jgi:cysteinyl-tRNA synthetase
MARKHLGETFDIHGGGLDLVFPHHENELAQSECCNEKPFVRYWLHNGFIERGGEKMAKSVGNIDKVRDLLDEFPGEALRLMLLKTHYRSPLEFTKQGLKEAKEELDTYYEALRKVEGVKANAPDSETATFPVSELLNALEDDLNTSDALTTLREIRKALNKAETEADQARIKWDLKRGGEMLGLLGTSPELWFRWQPKSAAAIDETHIAKLIDLRLAARKAKDFKEADRIRDELAAKGVMLEDGPKGTTWRRAG